MPQDVYKRLSDLEKRILHLEGLSPEYFRKNVSSDREVKQVVFFFSKRTYVERLRDRP